MKATTKLVRARRRRAVVPVSNNSLVKAFRILCCFSDDRFEMGVTELSQQLRIHKSTVYRFLSTMERLGLIEKNPGNDKYRLGVKLFELGSLVMRGRTVLNQARPYMQELARRANETVSLAVLTDGEIIHLDKIEPNRLWSIPSAIGRRFPAHCTALGKVMLANLPEEQAAAIAAQKGLRKFTETTITSPEVLRRHLEEVRRSGYAVNNQESERGLSCVAAPIWDHQLRVVAAVSVAGPTARFEEPDLSERIQLVKETALKISRSLGYPV